MLHTRKRGIKYSLLGLAILSILFTGFIINGCMGLNSRESFTQKVLKREYGEDFIVHEIDSRGPTDWQATVSPKNMPECLFYVYVDSDGNVDSSYCNAYAAYLMSCILQEDLEQFFPSVYVRMDRLYMIMDESIDFNKLPLEKVLDNSNQIYQGSPTKGLHGGFIDIYIDSSVDSTKQYEEEYIYFTDKVNEYISENKMVPIYATFYLVDGETLERVRNYYLSDIDFDSYFQNDVRGNVPEMSACFVKTAPAFVSKEEYTKRRADFENGK